MRLFFTGGIKIHAKNTRGGKKLRNLLFHPFGAYTHTAHKGFSAGSAVSGIVKSPAAVMADELVLFPVILQRYIAMGTHFHRSAGGTLHTCGKAAAV